MRDVVADGQARLLGRLPANQTLNFDIVLPLRDRTGLQIFLQQLYDPASPFHHLFITPQEFTERFGPSQEDWDALVAFAKANGFQSSAEPATAGTYGSPAGWRISRKRST